ncbi:transposase [Streptomyces sp. NPDC096030]|uniref:transposase n=1 Tax=Streptomyces sp. NPDC096030 TaxID=3155423 RepID=UPI00332983E4
MRPAVSQAVVTAAGITGDSGREVPGPAVGNSGTGAFWGAFLRSLRARGPGSVRLVITGHHSGLAAVRKVMPGSAWQRCRVRFLRNCSAHIPKGAGETAAATVRSVFAQPAAELVRIRLDTVAACPESSSPRSRNAGTGTGNSWVRRMVRAQRAVRGRQEP